MSYNEISKQLRLLVGLVLVSTGVKAQLPDTDIFLVGFKQDQDKFTFDNPVNITNRKGYDNQPSFIPGTSTLLYVRIPDSGSADIRQYELSGKDVAITDSPESEYSPSYSHNMQFLSMVRVDLDSGQRFYRLPTAHHDISIPRPEPGTDSIGYYCWMNDSMLAMFILGPANTLQVLNLRTHQRTLIASDIGRCMRMNPDRSELYFVVKANELEWKILAMNAKTYATRELFPTLAGSEDYTVLSDGSLLMGSKGKLYRRKLNSGSEWAEIADFSKSIGDFYRIAVNSASDRLALVGFTGTRP